MEKSESKEKGGVNQGNNIPLIDSNNLIEFAHYHYYRGIQCLYV